MDAIRKDRFKLLALNLGCQTLKLSHRFEKALFRIPRIQEHLNGYATCLRRISEALLSIYWGLQASSKDSNASISEQIRAEAALTNMSTLMMPMQDLYQAIKIYRGTRVDNATIHTPNLDMQQTSNYSIPDTTLSYIEYHISIALCVVEGAVESTQSFRSSSLKRLSSTKYAVERISSGSILRMAPRLAKFTNDILGGYPSVDWAKIVSIGSFDYDIATIFPFRTKLTARSGIRLPRFATLQIQDTVVVSLNYESLQRKAKMCASLALYMQDPSNTASKLFLNYEDEKYNPTTGLLLLQEYFVLSHQGGRLKKRRLYLFEELLVIARDKKAIAVGDGNPMATVDVNTISPKVDNVTRPQETTLASSNGQKQSVAICCIPTTHLLLVTYRPPDYDSKKHVLLVFWSTPLEDERNKVATMDILFDGLDKLKFWVGFLAMYTGATSLLGFENTDGIL